MIDVTNSNKMDMQKNTVDSQQKSCIVHQLGKIEYDLALDYQKKLFDETVSIKLKNRKEGLSTSTKNHLIFCEHPHVYTLGRSGNENNLLVNNQFLKEKGATFHHIGRGGDITYHGPGQVVCYPILDLENYFTDIHKYLRLLEEAVILTLAEYGIDAGRIDGLTGVWLDYSTKKTPRIPRKICAFGVKASRWVTMHGLALNVNTDLDFFNYIVPCGISDKAVTSIEKELGKKMSMEDVIQKLNKHLHELFEIPNVY